MADDVFSMVTNKAEVTEMNKLGSIYKNMADELLVLKQRWRTNYLLYKQTWLKSLM